ncbi:MarR family transcriptional regulator [Kribbella sandramycini]|uniref:MarR family transcriptional regulator n=1 Tax=Kribbella sandramycini TaxID=60450 RepID=A0A7Y4NXA0_9ACTN|nr:MarR family transcriptional regulator [Kribbella sandramycini]MBB6567742.1 DNA-binding MarR family transcriptional regulator [Kribbella sandramycini]NOL39662.1 MarR family transcriptional regulator [Kribbella sandramycini]
MAQARWLDDDEQATWRSFLLASKLLMDQVERDLKKESGLSFAYYDVLSRLSEAPGKSMRMADLAVACVFDRSRLSHTIDRLARDGWVRRQESSTDARGQLAVLTPEGMKEVRRAAKLHVERVRELMFDRLSAEQQKQLREIGEVLVTGIADEAALRRMGWPMD